MFVELSLGARIRIRFSRRENPTGMPAIGVCLLAFICVSGPLRYSLRITEDEKKCRGLESAEKLLSINLT